MKKVFFKWMLVPAVIFVATTAPAQIKLKIGSLAVFADDLTQPSCLQIPIFINDPDLSRTLKQLTITVGLSGNLGIIDGLIDTEMLVGNAFAAGNLAGLRNPPTDLSNNTSGTGTPACTVIFNQIPPGGNAIDFVAGNANGNWFINNNQGASGRKQALVINLNVQPIGLSSQNQDQLVAVVEIPVVANPNPGDLLITATPNNVVIDANVYVWDDGTRSDEVQSRADVAEAFDLSGGPGKVTIIGNADKIGVFRPSNSRFYLDATGDGSYSSGSPDLLYVMGSGTDIPLSGDWNGDGHDEIGLFRPSNNRFFLDHSGNGTFSLAQGDILYILGAPGDLPLVGDWNGDGTDEIGLYRPSTSFFFLDINGSGTITGADVMFSLGAITDIPVIGDWNNDGTDEVGLFRPSTNFFFLDANGSQTIAYDGSDLIFTTGAADDLPLSGDWNDDGFDEIGLFRPSSNVFYLDFNGNGSISLADDLIQSLGTAGDIPLTGNW